MGIKAVFLKKSLEKFGMTFINAQMSLFPEFVNLCVNLNVFAERRREISLLRVFACDIVDMYEENAEKHFRGILYEVYL